jgi:hypothetical protein
MSLQYFEEKKSFYQNVFLSKYCVCRGPNDEKKFGRIGSRTIFLANCSNGFIL